MGLIIKGTIPKVPPFSLWVTTKTGQFPHFKYGFERENSSNNILNLSWWMIIVYPWYPTGSMYMLDLPTFTVKINPKRSQSTVVPWIWHMGYIGIYRVRNLPTVSDMFFWHGIPFLGVGWLSWFNFHPSFAGYGLRSRTLSSLEHPPEIQPNQGSRGENDVLNPLKCDTCLNAS